jgi:hypothetical protein
MSLTLGGKQPMTISSDDAAARDRDGIATTLSVGEHAELLAHQHYNKRQDTKYGDRSRE